MGGERAGSIDEDTGDWVTIVSKFHFVDLAGSERVRVVMLGDTQFPLT